MFTAQIHSRKNSPRRFIGQRFEALESRRMFSFAPMFETSTEREALPDLPDLQEGAIEILLPPVELPYIPLPSQPQWESEPAPDAPIFENDEKAANPDESDGGLVDLGEYGDDTDTKPASDPRPPDVRTERETRAVLQMLATLQYPLADDLETIAAESLARLADSGENPAAELRRDAALGVVLNNLKYEPESDAGHVAAETLLNVAVPLDSAYDRYQAFEVWSSEEIELPPNDQSHHSSQFRPAENSAETTEISYFSNEKRSIPSEVSLVSFNDSSLSAIAEDPTIDDWQFWAPFVAFVNRAIQPTWTKAAAVVAVGFVLQVVRRHRWDKPRSDAPSNEEPSVRPLAHR